jgi:hypothetical protein
MFSNIIIILLNTIHIKILVSIKEKKLILCPPPIKNGTNNFWFFHHDHDYNAEKYQALKIEIEKLITKGHLQQFIRKNMQLEQIRNISMMHYPRSYISQKLYLFFNEKIF